MRFDFEFKLHIKARKQIENKFQLLPYGSRLIIYELLNRADPFTGIVSDISHLELSRLLEIKPAPGRVNSGTPSKQTIRNYIKSIERECGDYFKVISEGQSLKFLFPELPKIFNKFFENREVTTEADTRMALENTRVKAVFDEDVNTDLNTEINTPNESVKKLFININNNNNNNNNTSESLLEAKNNKQPIAADFYPNQETISRAIASGYSFATNPEIIQEFIDKNTAWGSVYADFNPIYLCFLAKYTQFQQSKQNVKIRNINNERTSPKNNSYEAAMERVRQDNQDAIEPSTQELFPVSKTIRCPIEHEPHFVALG